jgi:hypothetical protein
MVKYATAELNKVASRKTGEIEAQCKLDASIDTLENGAIMFVQAEDNTIVADYDADKCVDAMYLHFSNPRRYEDGHTGMENYVYENNEGYLPRLYKLTTGDIFTTNFDYEAGKGIITEKLEKGTTFDFGEHTIMVIESSAMDTVPANTIGATYRVIK